LEIKLASVLHHAASKSVTSWNGDFDSTALQRRNNSRGHKRAIIRADKPELFLTGVRRNRPKTARMDQRRPGDPAHGRGEMEGSGSRGGRWRSADRNFGGSMGTVGEGTERSGG